MEFVMAKTVLTKVKYGSSWFGIDYNMNLYRGCSHGCIYCDSRSNCYHVEHFDIVRSKKDVLFLLEQELQKKRAKGVIGIGSMSDSYNPQEVRYEITRGALKLIKKYGYGVSIDTKSDLVLRDIDLLKEMSVSLDVIVKFTVTTPYDQLSRVIEPNVCVSSRRFRAIKVLADAGVFVGILMNPILPFITDRVEDIIELVRLAHESGAKFIFSYMGVTLRENQRDYYFRMLDRFFPGLKTKYLQYYGTRYNCVVPNEKELYRVFREQCENYGILYRMDEIVKAYKKHSSSTVQLGLFDR